MTKDELRLAVRAARRARSREDRARAGEQIAARARPFVERASQSVTSFLHLPVEPPTDALNAALLASGRRVLVPRIVGSDLHWAVFTDHAELGVGPMGIREPHGPEASLDGVRTMFIPALAVDRSGMRLGQGGGFYDRALAPMPHHTDGGPLVVAVTFAEEFVDDVPAEWFDHRVDALITPDAVHQFG